MLKNKSGKIINITSVVGHTGNLWVKQIIQLLRQALLQCLRVLATEYAKKNININCVFHLDLLKQL